MKQTTSYWESVLIRDKTVDGKFFYAVRSTKIFCRPSCPSKRPKRDNVIFFKTVKQAISAGFRPCKRCHKNEDTRQASLLSLVKNICQYIISVEYSPNLNELSCKFQLSPYYLQKLFKQVMGISPKKYSEAIRNERLRGYLKEGEKVTTALFNAGYESTSSFYNQKLKLLGMTPSNYKKCGVEQEIAYTVFSCQLGKIAIAATRKGICRILLDDTVAGAKEKILSEFPQAKFAQDQLLTSATSKISQYIAGEYQGLNLPLDIKATAFQQRVWNALQSIPYGETRSYLDIAKQIGNPSAVRAVARACADNKAALIIPCHRVIKSDGALSGYRWGIERKQSLIEMENKMKSKNKKIKS